MAACILISPEVYLGPYQTSTMKIFNEISRFSISWLLFVNYFRKKKLHHRVQNTLQNTPPE